MENKKIKVVWVCHLSSEELRKGLHLKKNGINMTDFAQWNVNGITEFKKFSDVELHIISPHKQLTSKLEEFIKDNIHYHIFKSEDDNLLYRIKRKFLKGKYETPAYVGNSRLILSIINSIKPDIIHVIGAENPYYSISALSMPKDTPLIVALQTLMIAPDFFDNYPISKKMYDYRSNIERQVLQRADYISFRGQRFKEILNEQFIPKPRIIEIPLFVGVSTNMSECDKEYDFVYFAKEIEKAVDWVIEAFIWAHKKRPDITLNIVGWYSVQTKQQLDCKLAESGITDKVIFSGSLQTHDDVINQIRKARFAILPLKVDMISGTIREAMANGLPVVTTITPATPKLNEQRESVLLSEKGDYKGMAHNMLTLLEDSDLANRIQKNAYKTIKEKYDNETFANLWREAYYAILDNKNNGTPIPSKLMK